MDAKVVLSLGLIFFGGAVYALHTDKMKVVTVCRDSRLFMDGGIDATIEAGGLNFHEDAKLFRRTNNKDIYLGTYNLTTDSGSQTPVEILSAGEALKLSIFKDKKQNTYGYPGHLDALFQKEKISVNLDCAPKSLSHSNFLSKF